MHTDSGTIQTPSYSPDGAMIVSGGNSATMNLWGGGTLQPIGSPVTSGKPGP